MNTPLLLVRLKLLWNWLWLNYPLFSPRKSHLLPSQQVPKVHIFSESPKNWNISEAKLLIWGAKNYFGSFLRKKSSIFWVTFFFKRNFFVQVSQKTQIGMLIEKVKKFGVFWCTLLHKMKANTPQGIIGLNNEQFLGHCILD